MQVFPHTCNKIQIYEMPTVSHYLVMKGHTLECSQVVLLRGPNAVLRTSGSGVSDHGPHKGYTHIVNADCTSLKALKEDDVNIIKGN